jgi:hypothetical protein
MIKRLNFFLLTFVVLGFLQMKTSAMDNEDNLTTKPSVTVKNERISQSRMPLGETEIPVYLGAYIFSFLGNQNDLLRAGAVSQGWRRAAKVAWREKPLNLSKKNLTQEDCKTLSNGPFSVMALIGNQIGDEGAIALAQNSTLTYLYLGDNNIGKEGPVLGVQRFGAI